MLNIKELVKGYNYTARTFSELVPFMALWDEQTVACVDQGLMAVYEYDGLDAEGRADAEKEYAVQNFEQAFSTFGSGVTSWTYVDRRKSEKYPTAPFTDAVAAMIDNTWRERVTAHQYENRYTMAIHQRAETGSMAFFDEVDLIIKEEGVGLGVAMLKALKSSLSLNARRTLDGRKIRAAQAKLEELAATLQSSLKPMGLRRMQGAKLLAELHNRINPASPTRTSFPVPTVPAFLANLLSSNSMRRTPEALVFENDKRKYVGVISLKGFSGESETALGQLDWLPSINGEVTVAHCFRFIDRPIAEKVIDSIERYNISKSIPLFHRIWTSFAKVEPTKFNDGRLALAQDARNAKSDMYTNNRVFGYHNLTVLCYGETLEEMLDVRQQVVENLRYSRFVGHVERMHQLSAFTQTIPGQWASGVRWNFVSFGNAADLAPIRTINRGPENCAHLEREKQRPFPCLFNAPTTSGSPVSIDIFENGAGHLKVIGPTRAGKSTVTNFIMTMFRKYEPCQTIVIDKDYSCKVATIMQGGTHVDLNRKSGKGSRMSPLALVGDIHHHPFLTNWLMEMIEMGRGGVQCSPTEIEVISTALRGMTELSRDHWRIQYLIPSLGPDLGAYLSRWAEGGPDGAWFDNEPVDMKVGRHVCFECKELFEDKAVASLAMSYLFYLIECMLDDTPTVVSIEETWFFLDNERFAKKIDNFLRTLGKRNAALWIVTQNAKEIDASPIRSSILANIPNTIYLPDRRIRESADLYINTMGLLPEEIERIASATEKQHYYIKTPSVSRMLDMQLPEEIVVLLSASGRARATLDKHFATRDETPEWRANYFKEMLHAA